MHTNETVEKVILWRAFPVRASPRGWFLALQVVERLFQIPDKKRNSHSKNAPKDAKEIREQLYRTPAPTARCGVNGVDLSLVDGMGGLLAQTVTVEVGSNVGEKFPTEKHFSAWLGLAPKHTCTARTPPRRFDAGECRCDITGGKVLSNRTLKTKNRAGQAFRLAANSVKKADCPFGDDVSAITITVGSPLRRQWLRHMPHPHCTERSAVQMLLRE